MKGQKNKFSSVTAGYHIWPVLCLLVVLLEYLGMQLTVDQWLITQLQKSDSGNERLGETWVGYVTVWLLSNVVCKDETP